MDLIIKPRQLTITWGDDDRYWEWIDGETPRLLSVYWFMIRGRFAMSRLTHGAKYQLTFEVELESWAKGWESPVTLKMVFPDGRSTTRVETLDHHPREQLLMLCVGEFEASGNGEIKFKMGETNDQKEKKGVVIRRVVIQPSSSTTPLERSALPRNPAPQSNPSASSQCALETPPAKQAKLMEQRKEEDEEGVEEEGNNESLSEDEDEEEHGDTLCGACGDNYVADEFWICCDVCERWFHGRCVKITPARAEHIKQYKCPSCSN